MPKHLADTQSGRISRGAPMWIVIEKETAMNSLNRVRNMAQSKANEYGRPMAILNLNVYSPLYVVREVPTFTKPNELVEIVNPNQ